ncbi:hypothetical protein ACWD4P_38075 [Kitasatospora sp. NPDC002543]
MQLFNPNSEDWHRAVNGVREMLARSASLRPEDVDAAAGHAPEADEQQTSLPHTNQ